jgi:monoamine oxidase
MSALSRRTFLAGSAATVAGPALAAPAGAADFDILIIGAGVAGIAAANRVAGTGMKCLVLEAGDHLGGRCFTDTRIFGLRSRRGCETLPRLGGANATSGSYHRPCSADRGQRSA